MRKAAVVVVAFLFGMFVCRAPSRPTTANRTTPRSARIELPRRVIEKLSNEPLEREHRVRGIVETANGELVPDARVVARTLDRDDITETTSDEHGRFELAVDEGEQFIDVEAAGFARASEYVDVSGMHELRFQLIAGTSLRGRVVRDDGVACANARVLVVVEFAAERTQPHHVTADEAGRFAVDFLPAGDASITAASERCITAHATQVIVDIGTTLDVTVPAVRAFKLAGVVVEKRTGKPLAGAKVESQWQRPHDRVAHTDVNGRFVLLGFEAEEASVEVTMPGMMRVLESVTIVDRDAEMRIELEAGRSIRGRVEPPLAGVRVSIDVLSADPRLMRQLVFAHTLTDEDGTFELPTLPEGELRIVATADKHRGAASVEAIADREIVIAMEKRADVNVMFKVVERTGDPLTHTRVTLDGRVAMTDADGIVRFNGVTGGSGRLRVDGRLSPDGVPDFDVVLDENDRGLIVVASERNAIVRGRVIGIDGQPAAHVYVEARGDSVLTQNDGTFELRAEVPLPMLLSASSHDGRQVASIEATRTDVTIRLEERFHVPVRVTHRGVAIDRYQLGCKTNDGWMYSMSRHAGRLRGVEAGTLECQAVTSSGSGVGKIVVGRGGQNVLAIELGEGATITGRTTAAESIYVSGPRGYDAFAEPDATGRFTVTGLPPGVTTVGIGDAKRTVTTTPGSTVDVGEIRDP